MIMKNIKVFKTGLINEAWNDCGVGFKSVFKRPKRAKTG
jgi:hypothetical protein